MAKTYGNLSDEEKKQRIILVADYVIENKTSTRVTAKYISDNYFPISNVTVHAWLQKYLPKIDPIRYQKVSEILKFNTPASVEDAETKSRIYAAAKCILLDYTVDETARELESTRDTIYDDLTSRLPKLDKKIADDVKRKLQEHKLTNLTQYNYGVPDDESRSLK